MGGMQGSKETGETRENKGGVRWARRSGVGVRGSRVGRGRRLTHAVEGGQLVFMDRFGVGVRAGWVDGRRVTTI